MDHLGNPKRFAEGAKVIHIDIDAAEINKNIRVDAAVIGDLKEVLSKLNAKLTKQDHSDWMKTIADLKAKYPLKYNNEQLSCP
jgi:acetolactate synthase-1/2/3 large subunit